MLEVIILAAGEGKRMHSSLPKALHIVGDKPMLQHVIETANSLAPNKIHVVIGNQGELVKSTIERAAPSQDKNHRGAQFTDPTVIKKLNWVTQKKQLGSGDAAKQAMPEVNSDSTLLFLYADTPLIRADTLQDFIDITIRIGLATAVLENPTGFGRIVRNANDKAVRIIEEKDTSPEEKKIRECNTGLLAGRASLIEAALAKLDNKNAQKEFYLTDIIHHAAADGVDIDITLIDDIDQTIGVNSPADLARAERIFQTRQAERLLAQGVRLRDPARLDIRGRCEFGRDCEVDVNVILEGEVVVGAQCVIGANTIIRNSRIGDGCKIEANCVIEDAVIGASCKIGPFARIRPQSEIHDNAHIGNFVEIKKSRVGASTKINHLSYIGDSEIGKGVNIGAGVITCNYDGVNKHRTIIGDNVFVGSNSQLVAPLVIGDDAVIGAGSTITKEVAKKTLAISRAQQKAISNWARPKKK